MEPYMSTMEPKSEKMTETGTTLACQSSDCETCREHASEEQPVVHIDDDDYDTCLGIAARRNKSYSDGRTTDTTWGEETDSYDAHVRGALSEWAVCEYLGGQIDESVSETGDDGSDLQINSFSVDVKCTRVHWDPKLLVKNNHANADMFVATTQIDDNHIRLVGYCHRNVVTDREPRRWPCDYLNFIVDAEELRSFKNAVSR